LLGYGKKMQKPMKTFYDNIEKKVFYWIFYKVKTDRKIKAVPIKLDGPMFWYLLFT
jgi:hypothetical protein